MNYIIVLIGIPICYAAYVLVGKYEEYKEKQSYKSYKKNEMILSLIALKKAFGDNEYLYATGQINDNQYLRNIKKIDRFLTKLEVKNGLREKVIKL